MVLDTCVLYPTVMREVLLGVAATGAYRPVWSARILEEWRRIGLKGGAVDTVAVEAEIARTRAAWPASEVTWPPGLEARLWLPDPGDLHVLAAAVAGSADGIVTLNASDFPRQILAEEGLSRVDPDAFLMGFWKADPGGVSEICERVLGEARRLSGEDWEMRALMKKARLPRLGKAMDRGRDATA